MPEFEVAQQQDTACLRAAELKRKPVKALFQIIRDNTRDSGLEPAKIYVFWVEQAFKMSPMGVAYVIAVALIGLIAAVIVSALELTPFFSLLITGVVVAFVIWVVIKEVLSDIAERSERLLAVGQQSNQTRFDT
jgi:hypothetical protein